jgi:hypothetical protein
VRTRRPLHQRVPRGPRRRGDSLGTHLQLGSEPYTGGRNFGHLAYAVDNIYDTCNAFIARSVTINRLQRDGRMAFIRTPDGISIELLQAAGALPPAETIAPPRPHRVAIARSMNPCCGSSRRRRLTLTGPLWLEASTWAISRSRSGASSSSCGFGLRVQNAPK